MKPKSTKRTKQPTIYDFYLGNGEWFAKLTFANAPQIRRLFKGCKIKGGAVYLA